MQQPPNPYSQYPQQPGQQPSGWPQQPPTYYPPTNPGQQQRSFTGYPQWTQTPPPPPFLPPQSPIPPRKKSSKKFVALVLGIVAAIVFFGCIGMSALAAMGSQNATSQRTNTTNQPSVTQAAQQKPTQAAVTPTPTSIPQTPTPTHTPKWVTTQTFSGNGTKKTGFFTVPDNWKLIWKCDPASSYGGEYNVIVSVDGSDGSFIDPTAVNTICKTGNIGDSTDEHQGGQIYLDVSSEGAWTIQVQELK